MSGTGDDATPDFGTPVDPLDNALARGGLASAPVDAPASYKVMGESKIAVSKQRGKLWKGRKNSGQKAMQDVVAAWDEAIRYYNHDQSDHRDGNDPGHSGNRNVARRLNDKHSATENVVYSNVCSQLPELYAKDPVVEMTAGPSVDQDRWEQSKGRARAIEKLVNVLFGMKAAPGVNLKPRAKKAVVIALLTNRAWLEVGYVNKDASSDAALNDLRRLSQDLIDAKSQDDIEEAEAGLFALEEKIEFLRPAGPYVRIRLPHQVIVDPDHQDPWLSDANWIMVEDMLPTEYINAVYGNEDEESETVTSIYEPTHVLDGGADDDDEGAFSLFDGNKGYNAYGFDSQSAFDKAKRTKVWYVWDKVTRRLELYSDKSWQWPIWVWDDPYQLDRFFPFTPLWFHENPVAVYAKGEVSYYLDQQDMLNEINDERRRSLLWARRNIFFDKNKVTSEQVDQILKGPDATATGIDVPEGSDPTKLVFTLAPPSINYAQLFDKKDIYMSIDRIAATNDVMRGEQFKTNTTNKAIDYYSTLGNMRMDERLDAIEDCIGDVGWKIAQMCMRFMTADEVQKLIGLDVTSWWGPLDTLSDFTAASMTCVGGSTQKLTTAGKKQEAVQVGQILSQFARAAPVPVLKVTLRLFASAFDDMEITQEDWASIEASVDAMGGGAAPPPGGPPAGATAPSSPPAQGSGAAPPMMQQGAMIAQALQQMPPQVVQAIGNALAQGVPPMEVFSQMMQMASGGAGPPH